MAPLSEYYDSSRGEGTQAQDATPETAGASPSSPTSNVSPLASTIASQAVGYGVSRSPVASMPGIGGALSGVAQAGATGGSATQIGKAGIQGGVSSLFQSIAPSVPMIGSMLGAAAAETLSEDPSPTVAATRAGVSSLGALLGSALGPIGSVVGAQVAGYLGDKSIDDGYLGDALDSRSRERERDAVESGLNQSVGSTKGMAATDTLGMRSRDDGYGFGLSSNYGATKEGVYDVGVTEDPFGSVAAAKTLGEKYSQRIDAMMSDTGGNSNSNGNDSGGFGGGDGNDNDSGAGGGTGSSGDGSGGTGANGGEDGGASDGNDW